MSSIDLFDDELEDKELDIELDVELEDKELDDVELEDKELEEAVMTGKYFPVLFSAHLQRGASQEAAQDAWPANTRTSKDNISTCILVVVLQEK